MHAKRILAAFGAAFFLLPAIAAASQPTAMIDWQSYGSLRPADVRGIERAVTMQIQDVRRHWRTAPPISWTDHRAAAPSSAWTLNVVADRATFNGLCGVGPVGCYTLSLAGIPVIYVLDEPRDHQDVSISVSHEVIESDLTVAMPAWQPQACDPVSDYSYWVAGWAVSDYVFPSDFQPHARGPFDRLGILRRPAT